MSSERLKAAFRRLVHLSGGQQAVTQIPGIRITAHQSIGRYGRPQEREHAPIDVIVALEAEVGEPVMTREIADMAGFLLVQKDCAKGRRVTVGDLSKVIKQASGVSTGLADALSDGYVSRKEAAELRPCVRALMEVLAGLDASLKETG